MQNLGKVVVLLGGHSSEREVSLMSGEGVLKALREKGVDAHAFDPAREPVEALLQGGYDRAFIALHGGAGENGTIQGLLNFLRLPYTGPGVAASAASFDKEVTKTLWRAAGLPVPEGRVMTGDEDDAALEAVIRTGCRRVLTSGGRNTAQEGIGTLRALAAQAAGRIEVMAGSGVGPSNARLLAATGFDALHFSARRERESGMRFRNPQVSMGGCAGVPEYTLTDADESVVRQILAELG